MKTNTITRKILALVLALALVMGLCAASAEEQKQYKVGIILMVENGAFLDMKQGIIQGLAAAGYVEGENLTIDYQCAFGDGGTLNQICAAMDDGTYDVVVPVATPSTQAFVNLESETPCVFCCVAAPVVAGIMADLEHPDMNATGTSNAVPAGDILEMGLEICPNITTFGLVYCTSEINAVNAMNNAKAFLDEQGLSYVEKTVTNSGEVAMATEVVLESGVDAVFVANDSVVQSAVESLVEACNDAGVPTFACSATTVLSGCLATLAMSDVAIGEQTAAMVVQVLEGTPIEEIPCQVVPADIVSVNADTLALLGLTLPDTLSERGEVQMLSNNN